MKFVGFRGGATSAGGAFDDVFLFDQLPGGGWALAVGALVGLVVARRMLKQRRRREQLRRRREIRARLHAATALAVPPSAAVAPVTVTPASLTPVTEIDLTEPPPVLEIDLRDGVVYGSEITLESGETLETGIVGPD